MPGQIEKKVDFGRPTRRSKLNSIGICLLFSLGLFILNCSPSWIKASGRAFSASLNEEKEVSKARNLLRSADNHFNEGKIAAARREVEQAIALDLSLADAHFLLGKINYQEKRFAQAHKNFVNSIRLDPKNAQARYFLGLIRLQDRNPKGAAEEFKKAIEIAPLFEAAHFELGEIYYREMKLVQAEEEFSAVVFTNPDNAEARKNLSDIFLKRGVERFFKEDYLKARDYFLKSLEKNGTNTSSRYYLALTYLKIPHFPEAALQLKEVLGYNPDSAESRQMLEAISRKWQLDATSSAVQGEAVAPFAPGPRPEIKTIAVNSFDNQGEDKQYDWLKTGIAEALNADLSKFSYLKMIERRQVEELLKEERLSRLGVVGGEANPRPNLLEKVGEKLQANGMIMGGYQIVGENLKIDARLVDVESGEIINAVSVEGKQADLFTLERKLALGLIRNYIPIAQEEFAALQTGETKNLDAFRKFSQGRSLFYLGESQAAQKMYQEALKTDPRYSEVLRELALSRQDVSKADTLAILPFQNATGQAKFDWLAVGVAESLTTDLKKATGIFLVERMKIEEALKEIKLGRVLGIQDAARIGKQVGAGVILIGSYQALEDQIRVDARLVEVESGQILMSEKAGGKIENIFKVEEKLALKIAETLKVKLSPEELALIQQKPDLGSFRRYILAHSFLQIKGGPAESSESKRSRIRTIAVTEFENTSGDKKYDWMGEGIQNTLSTNLKQKGKINLIERSEMARVFEERKLARMGVVPEDLAAQAGQILGADAVITGDYQTVRDQLRINARLVNVSTGEILLAEAVEGKTNAIFQLQNQLADKIIRFLEVVSRGRSGSPGISQSPWLALGSSLLLPGSGQIFVNHKYARGVTMFGVEIALVGTALAYQFLYIDQREKYMETVDESYRDRGLNDLKIRNYLLAGVGVVAVFSAADAFILSFKSNRKTQMAEQTEEEDGQRTEAKKRNWNVAVEDKNEGVTFKVKYRF